MDGGQPGEVPGRRHDGGAHRGRRGGDPVEQELHRRAGGVRAVEQVLPGPGGAGHLRPVVRCQAVEESLVAEGPRHRGEPGRREHHPGHQEPARAPGHQPSEGEQHPDSVSGVSDPGSQGQPVPPFDESWSRALCVAAHPDDLEYGLAAAVDRWVQQGKTVSYLLATHGEAGIDGVPPSEAASLRAQEERDGAAEVGVEVVEFLEYDDGVIEYGLPLRRDIARAIRIHKPEVVITLTHRERFAGGGTNQADHRAVGLATLDATRDAANRWVYPELADEGYEPWGGVRWVCMAGSPDITHGVDVTGHLDAAVSSLQAHQIYLGGLGADYPAPPELLEMILSRGGQSMNVQHAVTLEVYAL